MSFLAVSTATLERGGHRSSASRRPPPGSSRRRAGRGSGLPARVLGRLVSWPRPSRRPPRGGRRRRSAGGSRNRSIALSIVTCLARPVARSVAVTLRMPLRSRSSRTRIWLPAGTFGQALDRELADQGVVPDVVVLALEDADLGRLLVVGDRREDLGPGGGQRRVAVDDRGEAMARQEPVQLARAP